MLNSARNGLRGTLQGQARAGVRQFGTSHLTKESLKSTRVFVLGGFGVFFVACPAAWYQERAHLKHEEHEFEVVKPYSYVKPRTWKNKLAPFDKPFSDEAHMIEDGGEGHH
eukprot:g78299.t1